MQDKLDYKYEYIKELQQLNKRIEKINTLNNSQNNKIIKENKFCIFLPLGKQETEKTDT